jgi:hypothetical protein
MEQNKPPKQHPPGLAPINYKRAGKILLPFGVVMVLLWVIGFSLGWEAVPVMLLAIGILDILVSCYLIFLTPREKP